MQSGIVPVVSALRVERHVVSERIKDASERLFGLRELPFGSARVSVELAGVPTAVVNALRRTVTDEMPHYALRPGTYEHARSTDPIMVMYEFTAQRLTLLPLRLGLTDELIDELEFHLEVENRTQDVCNFYAGNLVEVNGRLKEPIFNPTISLGFLQPGCRFEMSGIRIERGYGRDDGVFNIACRAAFTHLDLEQVPQAETHARGGSHVDRSGYVESCLVSNPRHHRLNFVLPAVARGDEGRVLLAAACENIKDRLRLVAATADSRVQWITASLKDGLNETILEVANETHTIGELVKRVLYEMDPDVSYLACSVNLEKKLVITVRHATADSRELLEAAVREAIRIMDDIQRGIRAA